MNSIYDDFENFLDMIIVACFYHNINNTLNYCPTLIMGCGKGKVDVSLMSKTHNTDLHIITCK